jgi:hypothetical protein
MELVFVAMEGCGGLMGLWKTHNEIVRLQAELDELKGLEYEGGGGVMVRRDTNPSAMTRRILELKQTLPGNDAYRGYGSVKVLGR